MDESSEAVQELIAVLRALDAQPHGGEEEEQAQQLLHHAERLATSLLVTGEGDCDWARVTALQEAGYPVFPLERDRFGWLLGGIQTAHTVVPFG